VVSTGGALIKLRALCAKQERCRSELLLKLAGWGLDGAEADRLLDRLEHEGFLNERRYAGHFAVSKLRQNGWGREKIRATLDRNGLSEADIGAGLAAIDTAEYASVLAKLVARGDRNEGLRAFLVGRGFEEDLVEEALNR